MALDELYELVVKLERRIADEGGALRQSEALTRYALVDPLLRALGWDTEDAKSVMPEYRSAAGVADYALFSGNGQPPALIIEAKKLGEPLDDIVALQSLCNLEGTPHFALTDGRVWKIYATFEQAPLADRLIVEFAIGDMDAVELCIKALALWRRSVVAGNVRTSSPMLRGRQGEGARVADAVVSDVVDAPVAKPDTPKPNTPAPKPDTPAPKVERPSRQSARVSDSDDALDWIPLSEYKAQSLQIPAAIMFPDGTKMNIRFQREIIIEVTRWLVRNGLLQPHNPAHCPIKGNTRYIISTGNVHPHGGTFVLPAWVDGVVWIETHADNPRNILNTCKIITTVNQDPSEFKVKITRRRHKNRVHRRSRLGRVGRLSGR